MFLVVHVFFKLKSKNGGNCFARPLAVTFCTKSVVIEKKADTKIYFFIHFLAVYNSRQYLSGFGINVNVNECRVIYAFKFWIRALISLNRKEKLNYCRLTLV